MLDEPLPRKPPQEDPATARSILTVVALTVAIAAVNIYRVVNEAAWQEAFAYPLSTYYFFIGMAVTLLLLYGRYLLWQRERRGWVMVTGLVAYSMAGPLIFWINYYLTPYLTGQLDSRWEIPTSVITTMLAYLLADVIRLYLLMQPGVRERLQISPQTLTNTVVIGVVAAVGNALASYIINMNT